jgi:hypothetical protein
MAKILQAPDIIVNEKDFSGHISEASIYDASNPAIRL